MHRDLTCHTKHTQIYSIANYHYHHNDQQLVRQRLLQGFKQQLRQQFRIKDTVALICDTSLRAYKFILEIRITIIYLIQGNESNEYT